MSTIVNSAGRFAGFSGVTTQKLNTALSGASQVDTSLAIPATSAGYVRVKITNGGGANTAVVHRRSASRLTTTAGSWCRSRHSRKHCVASESCMPRG